MCGSMVDILSATAEIRRGKKEEETRKRQKPQDENIMACPTPALFHRSAIKTLKPGLVASDDVRPGNGEGLFWFRRFRNMSLTYLLT